jgi:ketosteroid isomerase-like protein
MQAKQHLEQSMQEEQIREALNTHWHASAAGDANAEHDIYDDDAICDYPQSGERILGRSNLQLPCEVTIPASRQASTSSEFSGTVISGSRNTQSRTRGDQHTQ